MVKIINTKPDTLNLNREEVGIGLEHIERRENFQKRTLIAQAQRVTINKR